MNILGPILLVLLFWSFLLLITGTWLDVFKYLIFPKICNQLLKNQKFIEFIKSQTRACCWARNNNYYTDISDFSFKYFYSIFYIKILEYIDMPRYKRIKHDDWYCNAYWKVQELEIFRESMKIDYFSFIKELFK